MKLKNQTLINPIDNSPLKNGEKELTLFTTVVDILLATKSSKPQDSFRIAMSMIGDKKEAEIPAEDIVHIQETVKANDIWLPLVTGQILNLIK